MSEAAQKKVQQLIDDNGVGKYPSTDHFSLQYPTSPHTTGVRPMSPMTHAFD